MLVKVGAGEPALADCGRNFGSDPAGILRSMSACPR
jgi:hypothetical protein